MSLITDALKTAQREKNAQGGPSLERRLLEGFFPYGGGAAPEARGKMLLIGASVVVLLGVVGGGVLYARRTGSPAPTPVRVARPVPPPSAPAAAARTAATPVVQAGVSEASPGNVTTKREPSPKSADSVAKPVVRVSRTRSQAVIPIAPVDSGAVAKTPPALPVAAPDPVAPAPPAKVTVSASAARPGDQLFADAYAAHQAGNLDRAQELYERAIQTPPVSADVFNNYGALLVQRGDLTAAIRMYRQALATDRENVKAWINLGAALDQSGLHAEATSSFERVLQLDPNNVPVKLKLADQYQALGDSASARRLIEEGIRSAPKDPTAHYQLAALLERQRDFAGAVREYDAFLEFGASAFPAETVDQVRRHAATLRGRRP